MDVTILLIIYKIIVVQTSRLSQHGLYTVNLSATVQNNSYNGIMYNVIYNGTYKQREKCLSNVYNENNCKRFWSRTC